ncbi:IS1380 family transposase [Jatrophihabitans cynanchi]|uniref:IS1380 family transposase n=1 Tax=Jatrophihabitans cynanchi TaxID=2944128 RepID=A0ABY7K1Q6_9ACTN|nr:IS1380 family transposase [Jatrophihabitans sp. SB3-54]WAX58443.1 IS1380 family transposase [Jatrophihabitans sp. SB3-54]
MQASHAAAAVSARFDDPNLVSCGGLEPVLRLADSCGLADLVGQRLSVPSPNAHLKVPALVAGMVAGADSIDDMDLLRHGGMDRLFDGVRAPSTLGTFLRCFTFGHVRQLDSLAASVLVGLAQRTPLLPAADQLAFLDIDDTIRATHGYAKQGAGYGYSKVKGLNALLATLSTPAAAPVIIASRLRKGSTNSARGAARLLSDALATARRCGAGPLLIVRADSAYYNQAVIAAAIRAGARFSVTARMDPAVRRAIATIEESAWTPIHYPNAVWDEDEQHLVSDAEVAEIPFTAFGSRGKAERIEARLIVRRVKRLNPKHVPAGQSELFATYRHHAVFTDSPMSMLDAEADHRAHAIIEQVNADLKSGALAHLPSGSFAANSAWLVLAAIAFNLTRAAGCLASPWHAHATGATIRRHLITVPARIARSARRIRLHLPMNWPWHQDWQQLFDALHPPPTAA